MSSIAFRKVKSVSKDMMVNGNSLRSLVQATMKTIADLVGSTLGPGGQPVLIERQETGLPNLVTKDGVTVFRGMGFKNATAHALMETARDAAIRTATEAGDGTTTATVLSEALVRLTNEYSAANPKVSPQKIVRRIETVFRQYLEPFLKLQSTRFPVVATDTSEEAVGKARATQRAVVSCSTNGDAELTDAVMECFKITGDEGNVTLLERSGPSKYTIEPLKGYPLTVGYEESCKRFFPAFINDQALNRTYLERPRFILYFGGIAEIQPLLNLMRTVEERGTANGAPNNYVLMATGFGESLLADLAANFQTSSIKVFPVLIPKSIVTNGETQVLQDIQALTGAAIYDPLQRPIESSVVEELGQPLEYFEALRYRSNIIGRSDEDLLLARIEEVRTQLSQPESEYDRLMIQERLAKLTGGIAKLTVYGPSAAETREKRDRAEDATCALRGALRAGVLPGGGWGLVACILYLRATFPADAVVNEVLVPALSAPVEKLMTNAGYNQDEVNERLGKLVESVNTGDPIVWDGMTDSFRDATESGIMDSLPAVIEAMRNSISIATLLGTLGGTIVFERDADVEREESRDAYHFLKNNVPENPL